MVQNRVFLYWSLWILVVTVLVAVDFGDFSGDTQGLFQGISGLDLRRQQQNSAADGNSSFLQLDLLRQKASFFGCRCCSKPTQAQGAVGPGAHQDAARRTREMLRRAKQEAELAQAELARQQQKAELAQAELAHAAEMLAQPVGLQLSAEQEDAELDAMLKELGNSSFLQLDLLRQKKGPCSTKDKKQVPQDRRRAPQGSQQSPQGLKEGDVVKVLKGSFTKKYGVVTKTFDGGSGVFVAEVLPNLENPKERSLVPLLDNSDFVKKVSMNELENIREAGKHTVLGNYFNHVKAISNLTLKKEAKKTTAL